MIEDRNIICLASNWFYDPTSKHHVMRLLAERNHVVWVNYHGSRRPRLSGADAGAIAAKLRQYVEGPRRVAENITVITPLVVPLPGSRAAAAVNRRLLARQIRSVLRELPLRPVQLWSFAPDVDYLCGQFGEECVIYYCVDEFSQFSGYDPAAIRAAEARLARRADLVVTTSQALYEAKRRLSENVVLVTHGVDYEHFARVATAARGPGRLACDATGGTPVPQPPAPQESAVPADIAGLPRPVLGFWGLIQDWLDVELVAEVARRRPGWSVVLIGEAVTDVSALRGPPNVYLLGRRAYEQLPAYAKGFDIAMIPFRVNALTQAVNPIKLREYLSAGLPVVSTPLPEVQRYGEWVRVAGDAAGFVAACEEIWAAEGRGGGISDFGFRISDFVAAERQSAMRGETWAAKVEEVSRYVAKCLARSGKKGGRIKG